MEAVKSVATDAASATDLTVWNTAMVSLTLGAAWAKLRPANVVAPRHCDRTCCTCPVELNLGVGVAAMPDVLSTDEHSLISPWWV